MPAEPPFKNSICHGCRFLTVIESASSAFLRCTKPGWPKYPPQPQRRCAGRERAPPPNAQS
ncbi:MAG: hypothetical protein EXS02_09855 [Planctomycetes bacterium]|nr:hypothetical protein [Planctomycetota bacterium]